MKQVKLFTIELNKIRHYISHRNLIASARKATKKQNHLHLSKQ